jgi:tight adherence protein B
MDTLYGAIGAAACAAAVLLLAGLGLLWRGARGAPALALRTRVAALAAAGAPAGRVALKHERLSAWPPLHALLARVGALRRLDRLLAQAHLPLTVARLLALALGAGLAAGAALAALGLPAWVAAPGMAAGAAAPFAWARARRRARVALIEQQLPDALDLISRALRAGHALPPAIAMVATEMAPPLSQEFRILFDEINHGIALADALKNLAWRVPSADVGYVVVAMLVQRETGGNLTTILRNIGAIVRERLRLFGQVRVLSAEGRLSAWILGVLPFGLAAVIKLVNPGFMTLLWVDPAGRRMLWAMAGLMVLGVLWIRRIVRIKV